MTQPTLGADQQPRRRPVANPSATPGLRAFLLRGVTATMTLNVASTGLAFATTALLARQLGPTRFGAYVWALAWVFALRIPALLGSDRLVTREIAARRATGGAEPAQVLRWAERSVVRTSIAMAAVVAAGALLVRGSGHHLGLYLAIAMPMLPVMTLVLVRQAALLADRHVVWGQLPDSVLRPACFLAVLVPAALLGLGLLTPGSLLVAQTGAAVAALAAVTVVARRAFGRTPGAAARPRPDGWLRSGVRIAANTTIGTLSSQLDLVLLGILSGPRDVGIYAVVTRGANLVYFPALWTNPALAPVIVTLRAAGEMARLRRWITRITRYVFACTLICSIVLATAGGFLLHLVTPGFESGLTGLRLLLIATLLSAVAAFNGLILTLTGHERSAMWSAAAGATCAAMLGVALIPTMGVTGAAIAAIGRAVTRNTLNTIASWRKLGLDATVFGFAPRGEGPVGSRA